MSSYLRRPSRLLALGLTALAMSLALAVEALERGILDRPLPFRDAGRLVVVERVFEGTASAGLSWLEIDALRERSDVFSGVTGYVGRRCDLLEGASAASLGVVRVHPSFFEVLGIRPVIGRTSVPVGRDGVEEAPSIVITRAVWGTHFGGTADIIDRTLRLNCGDLPESFPIVGVVENDQALRGEQPYGAFLIQSPPLNERRNWRGGWFHTIARLAPGMTLTEASAAVGLFIPQLIRGHIVTAYGARAVDLKQAETRGVTSTFTLLRSAVAGLFVMALVNLALLAAADAQRRCRELALRAAIGAERRHLVHHAVREAMVFALAAGGGSACLATWTLAALRGVAPDDLPYLDSVSLWLVPAAFPVCLTVMIFGAAVIVPLAALWRIHGSLRVVPLAPVRRGWRDELLVGGQVLLVSSLLVYVGLALTGFWRRYAAPLGFDPTGVATLQIQIDRTVRRDLERFDSVVRTLQSDVAGIPGVRAVALSNEIVPARGSTPRLRLPDGRRLEPKQKLVGPGYFDLLRAPILAGRDITASDMDARVAVVNQQFARLVAGSPQEALGQRLAAAGNEAFGWRIVGVVRDMRDIAPDQAPEPTLYVPMTESNSGRWAIFVRADTTDAVGSARRIVMGLLPGVSVTTTTLVEHLAAYRRHLAFYLLVLSSLAIAALAIAALGILAITTHMVEVRTREIAIRFAIGGSQRRVIGRLLGRTLVAVGFAIAGGQLLGWALMNSAGIVLAGEAEALRPFLWVVPIPAALVALLATAPAVSRLGRVEPALLLRE